jgi:hypothetical protein
MPDVKPKETEIRHGPAEEGLKTAGQRRINLIWEMTQAVVALSVTTATLYNATKLSLRDHPGEAAFLLLSNAFFLVIGFYFGRTNHQRIGGIGPHEEGR